MNRIAEQLDKKLQTLDPASAQHLETIVREALDRAEQGKLCNSPSGWPPGYFEQTAGVLAGEEFQRTPQGKLPQRNEW